MKVQGAAAWWVSSGVHALLLGTASLIWLLSPPETPSIQIRLGSVSPPSVSTSSEVVSVPQARPLPLSPKDEAPSKDLKTLPKKSTWVNSAPQSAPLAPPVSTDWDSLVIPSAVEPPAAQRSPQKKSQWESTSDFDQARPELPPPPEDVLVTQGTDWKLTLTIPAEGGFPQTVEGLSSGFPELDRWLGDYVNAQSFPASLDGKPYVIHWELRLRTRLPE